MALEVIGTGLGRTGTKSMHSALNRLGFGPCHHMIEVITRPETWPTWIAAAKGDRNWDRIFAGYRSMVDWPGVQYWRELIDYYPDAKVLHTTRDAESWFESTQKSIFSPLSLERLKQGGQAGPVAEFFDAALGDVRDHLNDRDFLIDYFHRHEAEVKAAVPPERLLIFPVGSGWKPLCDWLGVEVPNEPFPSENSRAEFAARVEAMAGNFGPPPTSHP
jgi:hypothetical protein